MPRFACILLFVLLVPAIASAFDPCTPEDTQGYTPIASRYENALLFRIEQCGSKPSYLFGTIHSDNPAVWELALPVRQLLPSLHSAGFEFIPPANAATLTALYMFLPMDDPRGLRHIIGDGLYEKLTSELSRRKLAAPADVFKMKPWAAAVLLQMPPPAGDGVILDSKLQQLAADHGLELYGLETMEEQLALFDSMSPKQQVTMLVESLRQMEEIDRINTALESHYLQQDLRTIEALGQESLKNTESSELRDFFAMDLLAGRNLTMTQRLLPRLKQGGTLAAVGALHLPGAQGILALLEAEGYYIFAQTQQPAGLNP